MKITAQATVVNPLLRGKFVRVTGLDGDGDKTDFTGMVVETGIDIFKVRSAVKGEEPRPFHLDEFIAPHDQPHFKLTMTLLEDGPTVEVDESVIEK